LTFLWINSERVPAQENLDLDLPSNAIR